MKIQILITHCKRLLYPKDHDSFIFKIFALSKNKCRIICRIIFIFFAFVSIATDTIDKTNDINYDIK